jgi:rfaE bifunctional protein kinase chain/domain
MNAPETRSTQLATTNGVHESGQSFNPNGVRHVRGDVTAIFEAARERKVVVIGDLMLDEWIVGQASRISPEAPVPVLRLTERRTAPGGAANVAMNLLRLGARVSVCGVVGDDEAGADLARELREAGADILGLVRDPSRPTTLKTRIVAQRQQMVRVDRESDLPFSPISRTKLPPAWKQRSPTPWCCVPPTTIKVWLRAAH